MLTETEAERGDAASDHGSGKRQLQRAALLGFDPGKSGTVSVETAVPGGDVHRRLDALHQMGLRHDAIERRQSFCGRNGVAQHFLKRCVARGRCVGRDCRSGQGRIDIDPLHPEAADLAEGTPIGTHQRDVEEGFTVSRLRPQPDMAEDAL